MQPSFLQSASLITPAIQLQNLAGTSASKPLTNLWNLILKIRKNLTLWPKLIFQTCTKLLSTCLSSPTSTTVTTSTSFELPSPHARVTLIKFTKQEWVSDKGKQWSDSGPIKIALPKTLTYFLFSIYFPVIGLRRGKVIWKPCPSLWSLNIINDWNSQILGSPPAL